MAAAAAAADIILVFLIRPAPKPVNSEENARALLLPLLPTAAKSYNNQYEIPAEHAATSSRGSPSSHSPSSNKLIRAIGHLAPSRHFSYQ